MNITDIAAWWGAIIATLVFLFDIFKWISSGLALEISTSPNMETYDGLQQIAGNGPFVVVEVRNVGDRKTTITHLVGFDYRWRFKKLLRMKPDLTLTVPTPAGQPLPFVLEPGERWIGAIKQNEELEKRSRDGYLLCGIYHSLSTQPVLARVVINRTKDA